MCRVILVSEFKMERRNRQSSRENVTGPSSGTFLVAIRRKYPPPPPGQSDIQPSSHY